MPNPIRIPLPASRLTVAAVTVPSHPIVAQVSLPAPSPFAAARDRAPIAARRKYAAVRPRRWSVVAKDRAARNVFPNAGATLCRAMEEEAKE